MPSAWVHKEGLVTEAVNHALASHDWERVAQLIGDASESLRLRGETATLREAAAMAIGAAENRMTPLAILQAFDRIITDRNISLTFAPAGDTPPMSFSLGLSRTNWYPKILEGLRDVSRPGAHLDESHPKLLFILRENRERAG